MEKIYQASTAEGAVDFINMRDLEEAAKEVIPKGGYGYISSGAGDTFTYRENERAFNHKLIIPHVLKDIELPDTRTNFSGDTLNAPIIMAWPMSMRRKPRQKELRASVQFTQLVLMLPVR